jgi:hypothetical protein
MVAVGRKFAFPIDFSAGKHAELYSASGTVESYSKELASRLDSCREVGMLLVKEQRCWHRELINSRRRDPRVYSVGDIVFSRRATRSDSKRGQVDKLMHPFTGPWRIVKSLPGTSYEIELCSKPSRCNKKHAADLSPYPPKLIPFEPLDSADNRYGQLHKRIGTSPYKEAGIEGFIPPWPFQIASHYLTKGDYRNFHFPTLAELNDKMSPFPWIDDKERIWVMSRDMIEDQPVLYTGPPPSRAVPPLPSAPLLSSLVAGIINSSDRLFFISHSLGHPTTCDRFLRQHFPFPIMLARWAIPHGVLYPPSRRRSVQRIQPAILVAIPLNRRHHHTIPFYNKTSHSTFQYLGSACCLSSTSALSSLDQPTP